MYALPRQILVIALKVFDQLSLILSLLMAAAAVSQEINAIPFAEFLSLRLKVVNIILTLGFCFIWYCIYALFGLYFSIRLSTWKSDLFDVLHATTLGSLLLFGVGKAFNVEMATTAFLLLFWLYVTLITLFSRLTLRFFLERLRRWGINLKRVLIIGTNSAAVQFAQRIETKRDLGYRVIGFVDNEWAGTRRFLQSGFPLVTDFRGFAEFLRNNVVDEVIVSLPLNTFYREAANLVSRCVEQGVIVRFISDSLYLLRNMSLARVKVDKILDNVVISLHSGAMGGWPIFAKRAFDIIASLFLLGLFSPLFVLIAVAIRATSPGSVFFIQERIGLNKRPFRMMKFRTMVPDAERHLAQLEPLNEVTGPVFKIKDDPRITPIGRFLRSTSMDELPQLINVFQGDMSLVGPRPLPIRDYKGFSQDWHRRRFSVRPGITCLWQIRGRSTLTFEQWMHLDIEYIDRWTFWLDIKILLLTVPAVIREQGAY